MASLLGGSLPERDSPLRVTQKSINNILSAYLLPLLAAILGVFVHILRTASNQFRSLSFVASEVPTTGRA